MLANVTLKKTKNADLKENEKTLCAGLKAHIKIKCFNCILPCLPWLQMVNRRRMKTAAHGQLEIPGPRVATIPD